MPAHASSQTYLTATSVAVRLPDGRSLLTDVTFGLGQQTVGLIGPNGAGKSTLLSVLAGERPPDHGHVHRLTTRIGLVRQGRVAAHDTVADALGVASVLSAIHRAERGEANAHDIAHIGDAWDLPERTHAALAELGLAHIAPDRTLSSVSGGEATRIALAAQWLAQPDLLLLDEPTNDLDATSRDAVYALVARWPRALLVATHDRALLSHVHRILAVEHGTLVAYGGGWDAYVEERERQRDAAERERDSAAASLERARRNAQDVRERQARRAATGRKSRAKGGIPKILLNTRAAQSQATTARVARIAARVVDSADSRLRTAAARATEHEVLRIPVAPTGLATKAVIVSLRDATVAVADGTPLLQHVSLEVVGPERVALAGPNGVGKTTLLRVLAGTLQPIHGECYRGVPLDRVTYLDQHVSLLDVGTTVRDAFSAHHPNLEVTAVRAALARFWFRADAASQPVATLSGGERMRAALACVLAGDTPPLCLFLDEPTNHLDLDSLAAMEVALRAYDGAMVVVSHDAAFLSAVGVSRVKDVSQWRVAPSSGILPE